MKKLLFLLLAVLSAAVRAVPVPQITNTPNINVKDFTGWCIVKQDGLAVKYAAACDSHALYIIAEVEQQAPIYAGDGRGYADYNDGVELRINRGSKYRYLQIHIDAAGQTLILDQYKRVRQGNITIESAMTPGQGYRVFAAIPWDRLSPDTQKPSTVRVAAIRQKVLSPFKYDRKEQVVDDLTPGNQVIAGEKVAPSDFKRKIYPVMNYGRSGHSTVEIVSFLPVIYDAEPQLLLLMIGTNDVVYKQKWQTPEQFAGHYRKLCEGLKQYGCKVILITIPPCVENVANTHIRATADEKARFNTRILKMNEYIKAFGKEFNFPVVDYHKLIAVGDLESKDSLMRVPANSSGYDGIHPTAAGYRLLAAEIKKVIDEKNYPTSGIICVGDSITYGAHMQQQGSVFGDTYPAELLRLLEK
ncbi:MAG: hypothetical protein E7047_01820 [Lentisphaerae bacterium]|nr:hypothetical protein [Lentisphaerota bacterium]